MGYISPKSWINERPYIKPLAPDLATSANEEYVQQIIRKLSILRLNFFRIPIQFKTR